MKSKIASSPGSPAGKSVVVRGVIHGLLRGRWHGGGRLTEVGAATLFHVSRTPVREALQELAVLGIVELKRNCGAVFLPFGETELLDLYAVRSLLEVEAARLAATRIDPALVGRLKAAFESLRRERRPDTDWKLDQELHTAIAQASENPRLAAEIARYAALVQTMREVAGRTLADIHSTSITDHLRILHHLEKRNAKAAGESMQLHLAQAATSAVKAFKKRA